MVFPEIFPLFLKLPDFLLKEKAAGLFFLQLLLKSAAAFLCFTKLFFEQIKVNELVVEILGIWIVCSISVASSCLIGNVISFSPSSYWIPRAGGS